MGEDFSLSVLLLIDGAHGIWFRRWGLVWPTIVAAHPIIGRGLQPASAYSDNTSDHHLASNASSTSDRNTRYSRNYEIVQVRPACIE